MTPRLVELDHEHKYQTLGKAFVVSERYGMQLIGCAKWDECPCGSIINYSGGAYERCVPEHKPVDWIET